MQKPSNAYLLKVLSRLLILLVIAKVFSLVVLYILPSDGVELSVEESYQPTYQRVDFKNMIAQKKKEIKKEEKEVESGVNITNMILKGLYGTDRGGFIIVALKSKAQETTIVEVGDVYEGFELIEIRKSSAIFKKGGTNYTLNLDDKGNINARYFKSKVKKKIDDHTPVSEKIVDRNDIKYYAKNPKQIWREISIIEVKDGKKIKGFKVTRIDPKSKMATLGLKKNDLIIKANNVVLKSYRDALNIYSKIKNIDVLQLVVIRDGVQKEIVYEIN